MQPEISLGEKKTTAPLSASGEKDALDQFQRFGKNGDFVRSTAGRVCLLFFGTREACAAKTTNVCRMVCAHS